MPVSHLTRRLASVPGAQASGKVFFQEADFFSMTLPENECFDLVYDYTYVNHLHTGSLVEKDRLVVDFLWPSRPRGAANGVDK